MSPQPSADRDRRQYLTGFALALVLTLIPFGIVYWMLLPATSALIVVVMAAIAQIVVQLRYFLHIDFRTTPRENLVALFFAAFLIIVMVGGSLWIMFDLHYRHQLDVTAGPATPTAHVGALATSSRVASPARVERATIIAAARKTIPTATAKAMRA